MTIIPEFGKNEKIGGGTPEDKKRIEQHTTTEP
jgi:hypothetical protein